jgi:transcription-repair coupling factor (superfamily II helicase)
MNDYIQLYNINQEIYELINTNIDEETGELSQEASERFDKLQMKKEDIIQSVGLTHIINKAEAEKVDTEIKRLQSIKSIYSRREEAAKKIIRKFVKLGEEYKFPNLQVKWKKNPPSVVEDDLLDLEELRDTNPNLVKVSYSLDKMWVKELYKDGKPLPEGIAVRQDFSLQIR